MVNHSNQVSCPLLGGEGGVGQVIACSEQAGFPHSGTGASGIRFCKCLSNNVGS